MLKDTVKRYLLRTGIYIDRVVDESKVRSLIRCLRPMQTDKPLIRIGGGGDGGYLLPDDLEGIGACFSPGVGNVASFESELATRGLQCFLADYSVDTAPVSSSVIHFEKKFLGSRDDDVYIRLQTWISNSASHISGDLLLQMDIEGGEYDVLLDTPDDVLNRFRIIVIEFHELGAIFERLGFILINSTFQKLLKNFVIVHIHPNNVLPIRKCGRMEVAPLMEFTFLRKDRVNSLRPTAKFPHELDCVNVPGKPDVVLPSIWYS